MSDHDRLGDLERIQDFDDVGGEAIHTEIAVHWDLAAIVGDGRIPVAALIDSDDAAAAKARDDRSPVMALLGQPVQEYQWQSCLDEAHREIVDHECRAIGSRQSHRVHAIDLHSREMSDCPGAVLFDMDGTLIDSEPLWFSAEIDVMAELGSKWSHADQEVCLGGPLERVAHYMVQRSGTKRPASDVGALLLRTIEGHMRREPLTWRPGALDFLKATIAAGIPRALVTASWAVLVDAVAERMALEVGEEPFTVIVAGDHTTNGKPHPEPYLRAAELLAAQPGECLAIEDSPTGVRSAVAAGCVVVAVPHIAAVPAEASYVHVITTLESTGPCRLWQQALANVR